MNFRRLIAVAMTALTMVALPVPVAGAAGTKKSAASAKRMAKQIKSLKKQAAMLATQFTDLQTAIAALEANKPSSSPLIDPAGGDLTGLYPNPQLRTGTIVGNDIADGTIFGRNIATATLSGANIADGTIGSADITDGTIGQTDLAPASIGGPQLTGAFVVKSGPNGVGGNASGGNAAVCPPGARLLGGGAEWDGPAEDLQIFISAPFQAAPGTTWEVAGQNNSGSTHLLFAKALCLNG